MAKLTKDKKKYVCFLPTDKEYTYKIAWHLKSNKTYVYYRLIRPMGFIEWEENILNKNVSDGSNWLCCYVFDEDIKGCSKSVYHYELYRKSSDEKKYKKIKTFTKNKLFYDKDVEIGGKYSYKYRYYIKKKGKKYYSPYSSVINYLVMKQKAAYDVDYSWLYNNKTEKYELIIAITSDKDNGDLMFEPTTTAYPKSTIDLSYKEADNKYNSVSYSRAGDTSIEMSYDGSTWESFSKFTIHGGDKFYLKLILFKYIDMTSDDEYHELVMEGCKYEDWTYCTFKDSSSNDKARLLVCEATREI